MADHGHEEELRRKISALPKGTIVEKRIHGYLYPYRQWRGQDGRMKSEYVRTEDLPGITAQIAERRALEAELGRLRHARDTGSELYSTRVYVGTDLRTLCKSCDGYAARWPMADLMDYLASSEARVCLLYGLRRSGKTVMMLQAAGALEAHAPGSCSYALLDQGSDMDDLNRDLRRLSQQGVRFVFLDEVTSVPGFAEGAAMLSDAFARSGMRVVLAGTDSLSLWLAEGGPLYDRTVTIHTTRIPFAEHRALLGTQDVDDYIRHGGLLARGDRPNPSPEFSSWARASRYVDTAIASNIQRSLAGYGDGAWLQGLSRLHDEGLLVGAVSKVIQDNNRRFTMRALMRAFRLADLGDVRSQLRVRDAGALSHALDKANLDEAGVTAAVMRSMDIVDPPSTTLAELGPSVLREIWTYLRRLDIVQTVQEMSLDGTTSERLVIALPGVRYAFAVETADKLMDDPYFSALPLAERDLVTTALRDSVCGHILEDLVASETTAVLPFSSHAFKLSGMVGDGDRHRQVEYDLVVRDRAKNECRLIEVKHAVTADPAQARHMKDPEALAAVERLCGKVTEKIVLYRGPTTGIIDGICYTNVGDYLASLYPRQTVPPPSLTARPVEIGDEGHGQGGLGLA